MRKNTWFLVPLFLVVFVLAGCSGKRSDMPGGMPADPAATMPDIEYPEKSVPMSEAAIPPKMPEGGTGKVEATETVIGSAPVVETGTATVNLLIQDMVFRPETFTVKKGTVVKLTVSFFSSRPELSYDFSLSGHEAQATFKSGETASFEFTADATGVFPYSIEGPDKADDSDRRGKMVVIE